MSQSILIIEQEVDEVAVAHRMWHSLENMTQEKLEYVLDSFLDHAIAAGLKPSPSFVNAMDRVVDMYYERYGDACDE